MLVEEEAKVARDPGQDDGRGIRRFELAVANALDEESRADSGEVAEAAQEHASLVRRPPTAVPVDQTEHRGVDRDRESAARSGQDAAVRIDDLTAGCREVDESEGLALSRDREMRSPHDLERPEAEREEPEEAEGGQPDDSDAHEKAGAAVEVGRRDRDRSNAESSRNADTAPSARGVGDEVAQRRRSASALGTSRPLRRAS